MKTPTLRLDPRKAGVPAGFATTLDVLVRLGAPAEVPDTSPRRSPLHLAIVIDRSGSMAGQPLDEAKRAAGFLIDGLADGDRAAIIAYDNEVRTLVSLRDVADRHAFRTALSQIDQGGATNLHGGWFRGAEVLAPATTQGSLSRVILLSDGCANAGLTEPQAIARQCGELAEAGVTTSTYGLGRNFNEDLMVAMARAGRGNNYYGQTALDLMDPFREEFALLNAICARRVELVLSTPHGATATVLNGYGRTRDGHSQLPDLAHGGEAWALVLLNIPAQAAAPANALLLTASIRYTDMQGTLVSLPAVSLLLPVLGAAAVAALPEDEMVVRRAGELHAARLLSEARTAAGRQRWDEVTLALNEVQGMSAGNPWIAGIHREMEALAASRDAAAFAKETLYTSTRLRTRLAVPAGSVWCEDAPVRNVPAFARRKTVQGREEPPAP